MTLIIIAQENIREKNTDVRRDGEGYFFPEFVGQQDKHEKYETQCIMRLLKGKKKIITNEILFQQSEIILMSKGRINILKRAIRLHE